MNISILQIIYPYLSIKSLSNLRSVNKSFNIWISNLDFYNSILKLNLKNVKLNTLLYHNLTRSVIHQLKYKSKFMTRIFKIENILFTLLGKYVSINNTELTKVFVDQIEIFRKNYKNYDDRSLIYFDFAKLISYIDKL